MLRRTKSKDRNGRSPGPVFMNDEQMSDYLNDLRTNRPSRPTGARPPPSSFRSHRHSIAHPPISEEAIDAPDSQSTISSTDSPTPRSINSIHRKSSSVSFSPSVTTKILPHAGRPLVRAPDGEDDIMADLPYQEKGPRWAERQEARSLRKAMQDLDLAEEQKLYSAAQEEAGELVWKHQNPENPNAPYPYREHLKDEKISRRGSWASGDVIVKKNRSETNGSATVSRSTSGESALSGSTMKSGSNGSRVPSDSSMKSANSDGTKSKLKSVQFAESVLEKEMETEKEAQEFTPVSVAPSAPTPSPRKISARFGLRKSKTEPVGESILLEANNPKAPAVAKLASNFGSVHLRNPFSRVRNARASIARTSSCPPEPPQLPPLEKLEKVEIQRNPPTQSRNAAYTRNTPSPEKEVIETKEVQEDIKVKDGLEIRGDDIRKATSMSLKDRSPKLPTPTMVSDAPGRPIVSFQKDWQPKEVNLKEEISTLPSVGKVESYPSKAATTDASSPIPTISLSNCASTPPKFSRQSQVPPLKPSSAASKQQPMPTPPSISVSAAPSTSSTRSMPPIPTICVPDDPPKPRESSRSIPTISIGAPPSINVEPPSISVSAPSISVSPPAISVNDAPASNNRQPVPSIRPLPTPSKSSSRPLPSTASSQPPMKTRPSWATSIPARSSILCGSCALPIAGRIVTAAGVRFHPECFQCFHCAEALECVAFFPEPDRPRAERVERIQARMRGEAVDGDPDEDGDESLRFYCHLDFHEFFSPRCKSCKTPIEGDVVVACGAEWHAGHFFCAQCGDPFESTTPYVEKDGYAWCINCHTNRFSTKCKKCRKPVTDTVLKALGAEWHEQCFCCTECNGPFADGRYFLRQGRDDPFCPSCEERRLKS
ncbi:hypothetical protein BT63DRAFT_414845 [Microthyrium microscopicum]|uniref:LIM zinc-binding domain-containing protein n=1 Tax=Microthyrium microscopicum TaxID=703497 RepID=A0A6A6U6N5_9PEZI|nr:hypothetical protein BT63DRAFT_414845 [Microthyrium microscopicum]